MKDVANIRVGKAQVKLTLPAHTKGVREGNESGSYNQEAGMLPNGRVTARRSTGINPAARNPIDPRSPNLPPP